ncbi:tyrosine-protein kinase receptor TYRO3 isoform X1 [Alosa sapidissima]|uniref:tyrosine-protein kinase receptor TYRO3 isoform X1 n=1 Tax=Alosa sapidissima TaxID=34773 RepID=UPI001C0820A8|nr:tyrosine-protein kinase receptor TYRO3 isoform X1 [Alosa sapidissima]
MASVIRMSMMWTIYIPCLTWICVSIVPARAVIEEELFNSLHQTDLKWTSSPQKAWSEITFRLGADSDHSVFQACANIPPGSTTKRLTTFWIPKKDARNVLLDIKFAQEIESESLSPLTISVKDPSSSRRSARRVRLISKLSAPKGFPVDADLRDVEVMEKYLHSVQGIDVGEVSSDFQLDFSYSGPCVFVAAVRLYYKQCPTFQGNLTKFRAAPAGSGLQRGTCAGGSVEDIAPQSVCGADGSWGPLQGMCLCPPGHEEVQGSCKVCRIGTFKPNNGSGGCHQCPPNSETKVAGAQQCVCVHGYSKLRDDPVHLGCTKSPSEPVNLTHHQLNDSTLTLRWEPPSNLGGRQEVTYTVECWQRASETSDQWAHCNNATRVLPRPTDLTATAVNVTGLQAHLDYKLVVRASNAVGSGGHTSTTIHKWKVPVINPATPSEPDPEKALVEQGSPSLQLLVGVLGGGVLLMVLVPAVLYLLRRKYKRLIPLPEEPLLPLHPVVTYRRDVEPQPDPVPPTGECARGYPAPLQVLAGLNERLLSSLKEVLVERASLTLGKELGKGEFGSVFEGIFSPQGGVEMKVAVKTMRAGIHSHEDLETFLKEAEIMRHFDHENVVSLLGVTLEHNQDSSIPVPLVILPFLRHGDLRRFLIATRYGDIPMFVPYQSLLRFMIDIAAGMEYLSSKGFLHRDLAARNCMLGDDLHVRVADFGLSKSVYSGNYYRQKVAIRLPMKWMAMESLSESMFSIKTDVWSFGVTMWEIMSRGKTPYPGVHNHDLLAYLEASHRLKPPADCESTLYEVMQSCWKSDPAQRPGFAELGMQLKGLLSELPPLEASKEAHYINQGLEAAIQGGASGVDTDLEEAAEGNIYLPEPYLLPHGTEQEGGGGKDDEGYLLFVKCGSAHGPKD